MRSRRDCLTSSLAPASCWHVSPVATSFRCFASETHRPSWLTGPRPHCSMPVLHSWRITAGETLGTAVLQISMSARDVTHPTLDAGYTPASESSCVELGQSLLAGGVHIRSCFQGFKRCRRRSSDAEMVRWRAPHPERKALNRLKLFLVQ